MKTKIRLKKLITITFLGFLFLAITTASYFYFLYSRIKVNAPKSQPEFLKTSFNLTPIPTAPIPQTSYYNILLLGYGGADHSGGNLSDSVIVVHIDPTKNHTALISIPRDLWIPLPAQGNIEINKKINSAFAIGGGQLAKSKVSTVIGMPIHYFVAVSFTGFQQAIDILGGVDIDVPVTFDDHWYPVKGRENDPCNKTAEDIEAITATMSGFTGEKQFPCRYEHIHFDQGLTHMDGKTALKFVRSRHSAQHGGDFARSERQQALLFGIKDTLLSLGALDDAIPFFNKLSHTIQTDLNQAIIKPILDAVGDKSQYTYSTIQLTQQNVLQASTSSQGASILIPKAGEGNWTQIQEFIKQEIQD